MTPSVAIFNNKGGVGKTTLVYHLAAMMARLGLRVLCADLDPQANLTSMFFDDGELDELYESHPEDTIFGSVKPIVEGIGGVVPPKIYEPSIGYGSIGLIAGDLALAAFEDLLAESWSGTVDAKPAAARTTTAMARVVASCSRTFEADLTLIDVGPNLGAINRAALIGADHVIVPIAPDLFSLRGLRNLGPTLAAWRIGWQKRVEAIAMIGIEDVPQGRMSPLGYVILQHAVRLDKPARAYGMWASRIPPEYQRFVKSADGESNSSNVVDNQELGLLKNYRSLMPLAQEARKPMFSLKVADGALGAQQSAVLQCYADFEALARRILDRVDIDVPA